MQQIQTFIGIDISKLTLDVCLLQGSIKKHFTIANTAEEIRDFFILSQAQFEGCWHIGMENTGCYNFYLYQVMAELGLNYYVIPPLHLKKSLGLSRGKNDKVDALRIATFLELNIRHLSLYKPKRAVLQQLSTLLTIRSQRIKIKKQLSAGSEQYPYISQGEHAFIAPLDKELVDQINEQIKAIEQRIQELVQSDDQLYAQYKLLCSVQGVGKVLSWNLLTATGEFNDITDPRKLACYCGVAPFEHTSGTSIRGKTRVSHYANKGLKTLLHLAAMSAIRLEGDLRDYYQRKVAEGKNKMCVLNAVRNKIIHRVYAVLKNQRPYQKYLANTLVVS